MSTPIRSEPVKLDLTKIEKHNTPVGELELKLEEMDGSFFATLEIGNYPVIIGNIKRWENRREATAEFAKMVEAVAQGDYKIDLYENGEVKVSVQY